MKKKGAIERIDLSSIKDPSFLKTLDYRQLESLCGQIREEILRVVSTYGGHLSSNLGDVELTVALHRVFDFKKDKLIFDVGHQCYAHKILTGRKLDHLNEAGYCNGFQNRKESLYDPYDAGHSSTSLSAAEAFAYARDLNKETYDVVDVIGDSSITNGLAFEALNNIGERRNKVIIVLNDNGMSISKPVGGLNKFFRYISTGKVYNKAKKDYRRVLFRTSFGKRLYSFTSRLKRALKSKLVPVTLFDNMGFTYLGPIDGHNFKDLEKAFRKSKNATKSVVIHVLTAKGRGYPLAEEDKVGDWHGVAPFDLKTGRAKDLHEGELTWSKFFAGEIRGKLSEDPNAILITPATENGSELGDCFAAFPDRSLDVGIAEEHALTFAGALSIAGKKPIVSIYSSFLQRAYDEISHDCARMGSNLTLLIDRSGLVGKNGETHQGIYDVAFLKSIPGVVVSMPATPSIGKALFRQSFENRGVFAIRYPHAYFSQEEALGSLAFQPFLCWRAFEKPRSKAAVIGIGPLGEELRRKMKERNLPTSFFDPVYLNPIPENETKKLLIYKKIFVYDPYGTEEGFAESLLSKLAKLSYSGKVFLFCAPSAFIPADTYAGQLASCGLAVDFVLGEIESKL